MDENSVYYQNLEIDGANPLTFEVLTSDVSKDDKMVFEECHPFLIAAMSGLVTGRSHAATSATFTKNVAVAVFESPRIRIGNLIGNVMVIECPRNIFCQRLDEQRNKVGSHTLWTWINPF